MFRQQTGVSYKMGLPHSHRNGLVCLSVSGMCSFFVNSSSSNTGNMFSRLNMSLTTGGGLEWVFFAVKSVQFS